MYRESFTEEKTRKISLFAHLCALRDNCAALLINEYCRLFVDLLLSVEFLYEHSIRSTVWPLDAFKVHRLTRNILP